MKAVKEKLNPVLKNQIVKTLGQLVADLKDQKEATAFLQDFFDEDELDIYSKRLAIIYWLRKRRGNENIKTNLKVSSGVISSTEKLLNKPGIKLAIKKLEAEEWANVWSEKIKKFYRK